MNCRNLKSFNYDYSHAPWTSLSYFDIFLSSNRDTSYSYSCSYLKNTLSSHWDYVILLDCKKIFTISYSEFQWIFSKKS